MVVLAPETRLMTWSKIKRIHWIFRKQNSILIKVWHLIYWRLAWTSSLALWIGARSLWLHRNWGRTRSRYASNNSALAELALDPHYTSSACLRIWCLAGSKPLIRMMINTRLLKQLFKYWGSTAADTTALTTAMVNTDMKIWEGWLITTAFL